jgi:uncharacterized membrane protein YgdD (TMEM256/DUF423 family)
MARLFLCIAAVSGFLAVALGAFGSHALRGRLDDYALSVFQTAVQYHFFHTFALLAVALLCRGEPSPSRWLIGSGTAFVAGLLIFCGSLYLLSITGQRWLGAVTPIGGLGFLAGWLSLAYWATSGPRML